MKKQTMRVFLDPEESEKIRTFCDALGLKYSKFFKFVKRKRLINGKTQIELNMNTTNTTIPTNSTKYPNNGKVELVESGEEVDKKKCYSCGSKDAFIIISDRLYCPLCVREVSQ